MKYDNPSKLCPRAMKPALVSSFYLKIKKENDHLIGVVMVIEILSSMLPRVAQKSQNFQKSLKFCALICQDEMFKKKSWNHPFCDH